MNSLDFTAQRKRLYEEVIEQLFKLLSNGDYQVGDKLPSIPELTEIFGVGKPTLREALSVLASTGVVEIRQGKGIYIKRLSANLEQPNLIHSDHIEKEAIIHWLEFRKAIEIEAAGLAAIRHTDAELEVMEKTHKLLESELLKGQNVSGIDFELHQLIAKSTHNPMFIEALNTNSHILQHQVFENLRETLDIPSRIELVVKEHKNIIESIKKKDPNAARRNMAKHLENALRKTNLINL